MKSLLFPGGSRETASITMREGSPNFDTTLWSQVLIAAQEPDSSLGQQALERLCAIYWHPIYAHIRRQGISPDDAEDLTQGFFVHMLSSGFLSRADAERGRFRNFMLGALRNYLGNERDKRTSLRRGGKEGVVAIDTATAEQWLSADSSPLNDATKAFDRSWASTVIGNAVEALEREQQQAGKGETFELLKDFLQRSAAPGEYDVIATRLKVGKGAVAAAVHRLNERFGDLVRKSVRDTIADPQMAEEELRCLYSALHT